MSMAGGTTPPDDAPAAPPSFPLAPLAALPGVMGAALLGADGELLQHLDVQGSFPKRGLTAALAASGVLSDSLGGQLRQAVFAYRGGPWLLVALPHAEEGRRTLALRLSGLSDLARVRFELPRLLGPIQAAGSAD